MFAAGPAVSGSSTVRGGEAVGTPLSVTVFHLPTVDGAGQAVQWPLQDLPRQLQLIHTLLPGHSSGREDLAGWVAQAGAWGLPLLVVHQLRVVQAVRLLRFTGTFAGVRPDEELAYGLLGCKISRRGSSAVQVWAFPDPPEGGGARRWRPRGTEGRQGPYDAVKAAMDQPGGI